MPMSSRSQSIKNTLTDIEKVQRRATKIVHELSKLTYQERLIALGLPSIKYRHIRSDLIQTYTIIHKIDKINSYNFSQ